MIGELKSNIKEAGAETAALGQQLRVMEMPLTCIDDSGKDKLPPDFAGLPPLATLVDLLNAAEVGHADVNTKKALGMLEAARRKQDEARKWFWHEQEHGNQCGVNRRRYAERVHELFRDYLLADLSHVTVGGQLNGHRYGLPEDPKTHKRRDVQLSRSVTIDYRPPVNQPPTGRLPVLVWAGLGWFWWFGWFWCTRRGIGWRWRHLPVSLTSE
eukprot:COSAG01_NODE_533_length_15816_cov_4.518738_5_plen_213_part_00